jgi:ABC-type xylose transport system substrate-binding protein
LLAGALLSATALTAAHAEDIVVGVSWSNFQEERWKTDEAAIKSRWKLPARNTSPPTLRARLPSSCPTLKP